MIYVPSNTKQELEIQFKKLKPLTYNRFWWWRSYKEKHPPLGKKQSLRDKILNGDFDYSHYRYQAEMCEHNINEIYEKYYPDIGKINENISVLRARRNRLMVDFEKDEKEKLNTLFKEFTKNFKIDEEKVIEEMLEFGGDLIDFYYLIEDKYKLKTRYESKPRGTKVPIRKK